jgi:type VI secretion system VasI/ImpG family protein
MSSFLQYYEAELDLMRRALSDFEAVNPEKARALGMSSGRVHDPDLQRIADSFAYVAARLQKRIEDANGDIALELLRAIAPSLLLGAPSHISLAPASVSDLPDDPVTLAAGTRVPFGNAESVSCVYTIARNVGLSPLVLTGQRIETVPFAHAIPAGLEQVEGALVLELQSKDPARSVAQSLGPNLEFYLPRKAGNRRRLAESLAADAKGVAVAEAGSPSSGILLKAGALARVMEGGKNGFLPRFTSQPQGMEQLHDFLAYPDQAYAFRLTGLARGANMLLSSKAEIRIFLGRRSMEHIRRLETGDIVLNALPCINLFETVSEPQHYSFARDRMPVRVPPGQGLRPEILRILSVTRLTPDGETPLSELAAPVCVAMARGPSWQERLSSGEPDPARRDISLSIPHDENLTEAGLDVIAQLLCSNGAAAMRLRPGDRTRIENDNISQTAFAVLEEPSPALPPRLGAERQWDLVALIGGNFNALLAEDDPARVLRDSLHMCAPTGYAPDAKAIIAVNLERRFAPIRLDGHNLIASGVWVDVVIDPDQLSVPATVFGHVLADFLTSFVSHDRFLQLQLRENGTDKPFFSPVRRHGSQMVS